MNNLIRVAVAEDEQACVRELVRQLHQFEKEHGVVFDIKVYKSAIELLEAYQPVYDLLFLDIEMPVIDGLSAAKEIYEMDERVMIMFVTRIARYAVQSYDVNAVDYVLKPLQYPFFSMKLEKVLRRLRKQEQKFLLLQGSGVVRRVAADDIYYVEVADHKLTYHTVGGDYIFKGTMGELEKELAGESFVRCNSCFLINLMYFQEFRDDMVYVHGHALKVSRNRRKAFLEAVLRYQRGSFPSKR